MDDPLLDVVRLAGLLSAGERERAAGFRFERHRRRYVIGRAALRGVLGTLVDCDPAALPLLTESGGKPALRCGPAFNVSHSEEHLVIGIAHEGRLGVDAEVKKSIPDAMELANGSFADDEIAVLETLSASERSEAFLKIWTRKESLLKALGTGLSMPLNQVSMQSGEGQGNQLISSRSGSVDPRRWWVRSVGLRDDLEVAVAWDRPDFSCRVIQRDDASLALDRQGVPGLRRPSQHLPAAKVR
ncbi:MAG: 4'-phosphopantetheinyl transferase superfamily protein [Methylotetracoccus sp.]|nr:4'-phosphopantetheinyl transferase superfamily protein [Methylotetracoccus sp.]